MQPLAERMRPKLLADVVGQAHLLGENAPLRSSIDNAQLPSIIFCGPPGVGKTSLASVMAQCLDKPFISLSAIHSGVKDIKDIGAMHNDLLPAPIVFIDEIHRFNKTQQDALLPIVEKGKVTLIGATTENPSFAINHALLSRCQVYQLHSLQEADMLSLLNKALHTDVQLKNLTVEVEQSKALLYFAAGDARKLFNLLELVINTQLDKPAIVINDALVESCAQQAVANYDRSGDQHYDMVSAMIKSIRGSDADAALYWMARMIDGGEDPVFIARRLLISASEDIGLANPNALLLAGEGVRSVQALGYPECRIILGQVVVYLATSAKSNSSYQAINAAIEAAAKTQQLTVPMHLRNSPTTYMKEQGYGAGYLYPHHYTDHYVAQQYLPDALQSTVFYTPANNSAEQKVAKYWQAVKAKK